MLWDAVLWLFCGLEIVDTDSPAGNDNVMGWIAYTV